MLHKLLLQYQSRYATIELPKGRMEKEKMFGYTQKELKSFYLNNKVVAITSNAIYQLHYSQAQEQCYFTKVNLHIKGLAKKGRHYLLTPMQANYFIGENLFI